MDSWKNSVDGLRAGQNAGRGFAGLPEHAMPGDPTPPSSAPLSRAPLADGHIGNVYRQQELLRLIETSTDRLSSNVRSELQVSYRSLSLGRVTVNLQEQGGTLNIAIHASRNLDVWRSETTWDQLVQALEGLGYDDVLLEFGMHDSSSDESPGHSSSFADDVENVRLPEMDDERADDDWTVWKEMPPEGKVF